MFFRYLLYAFLIYLLYRLVFHFIIPVYKTSRQVKKEFQHMQDRMQEYMNQQQAGTKDADQGPVNDAKSATPKPQPGDYIDFEEVK